MVRLCQKRYTSSAVVAITCSVVCSCRASVDPSAATLRIDRARAKLEALVGSAHETVQKVGANVAVLAQQLRDNPTSPIPSWVWVARLTSPYVFIVAQRGAFFALPAETSSYGFELREGDHDLWFDGKGALWGYDKAGKIFRRDASEAVSIGDASSQLPS